MPLRSDGSYLKHWPTFLSAGKLGAWKACRGLLTCADDLTQHGGCRSSLLLPTEFSGSGQGLSSELAAPLLHARVTLDGGNASTLRLPCSAANLAAGTSQRSSLQGSRNLCDAGRRKPFASRGPDLSECRIRCISYGDEADLGHPAQGEGEKADLSLLRSPTREDLRTSRELAGDRWTSRCAVCIGFRQQQSDAVHSPPRATHDAVQLVVRARLTCSEMYEAHQSLPFGRRAPAAPAASYEPPEIHLGIMSPDVFIPHDRGGLPSLDRITGSLLGGSGSLSYGEERLLRRDLRRIERDRNRTQALGTSR